MSLFDQIEWREDRMLLGDIVFRFPRRSGDSWDLGEECVDFYKLKKLVDQYELFLGRHPDLRADHMLELGIFGGGSMVFWYEYFRPRKYVGVDIKRRTDTDYFRRFVTNRGADGRVKTYWGTSQDDVPALTRIVEQDFGGHIDLVIDDASHFYEPTLVSFETLFPFVRPGGYYIIEDWAWAHWRDVTLSPKFLERASHLTNLVARLVAAAGTDPNVIKHLEVYQGFAVVERGPATLTPGAFKLGEHIYVRPRRHGGVLRRLGGVVARMLSGVSLR